MWLEFWMKDPERMVTILCDVKSDVVMSVYMNFSSWEYAV